MGRTKGAKDLPPRKKAIILAQKNCQELPSRVIGKKNGVSHTTVQNITPESVPPEVLIMSERYRQKFQTYAEANAMKAAQRTFNSINELNAKDAAIVMEKNFNIIQTIENGSTTKYKSLTDEELAGEMLSRLLVKGFKEKDILTKLEKEFPAIDVKSISK